jgi:hypothetical protein
MKINEKNTALHLLNEGDRMPFGIDMDVKDARVAAQFLHEVFPTLRPLLRQRVQFVRRPFMDAYVKVQHGLDGFYVDVPVEQSGAFIFPSGDLGTQTLFYQLLAGPGRHDEREIHCTIVSFINVEDEQQPKLCYLVKRSTGYCWSFDEDGLMECRVSAMGIVECIVGLVIFSTFWERKTKIILPGQQAVHGNQRYDNDTKQPIEILNWAWFKKVE